jgi:hypothetical protein
MWLGDPVQYKHYDQLQKLMQCMLEDYAEWKLKYDIDSKCVDAATRYEMPPENANGFMALPIIDARKVQQPWADGWERTVAQAYECPGMIDMCINFIRPGKMLPVHHDGHVWSWIRGSMGKHVEGFTTSFGIHIPDPTNQCLVFDGESKVWNTGEFRTFNGEFTQHYMKNLGSDWRITGVMEIEKEHYVL